MHSYGESRNPEVAGGVTMEGDILAYLNQKEFPTYTYPRSSWTLSSFRPPRFLKAHVFLSVFARRWSDFSPMQHAQLRMSEM